MINARELAQKALKAYQNMLETVIRMADSVPGENKENAKKELQETVHALITRVISADNKLKQSESDFMNEFFSTNKSLPENLAVLKFYHSRWPELLNKIPAFLQLTVKYDKVAESRNAATLVCYLQIIGGYASAVDGEQQIAEQETLASYLADLDTFLADEGVQLTGLERGKSHSEEARFRANNEHVAQMLKSRQVTTESQNVSLPTKEDCEAQDKPAGQSLTKSVRSIEEILTDLEILVGLKAVKHEVRTLTNLIKIRKQRASLGLPNPTMSCHLVFSGNPGTGKTTIARLIAEIYGALGFLSKGHLVETDRAGLVGGYMGQTAIKVKDVVTRAFGGVLFIDEAYSLSKANQQSDYGHEAIDTLLKLMEDNRQDLVVIVAGYTNNMADFLKSNPGLESRFNRFIGFEDYSAQELYDIFVKQCEQSGYTFDVEFGQAVSVLLQNMYENRTTNWGNARAVRNLFEATIANQANRLGSISTLTRDELATLIVGDLTRC